MNDVKGEEEGEAWKRVKIFFKEQGACEGDLIRHNEVGILIKEDGEDVFIPWGAIRMVKKR